MTKYPKMIEAKTHKIYQFVGFCYGSLWGLICKCQWSLVINKTIVWND